MLIWSVAIQAALQTLGFGPALHGLNGWMHHQNNLMWIEGLRAKLNPPSSSSAADTNLKPFGRKEFDNLLGEYEMTSDAPCIAFSEELIRVYPEAKVIIVERDMEAWYTSFHDSVIVATFNRASNAIRGLDPGMRTVRDMNRYWMRLYFHATTRAEAEQNARTVYKEHYERIRRVCPKENLLDFKLSQGWQPLCAFLGKEVPDVPFPRVNDRAEFKEKMHILLMLVMIRAVKRWLWLLGSVAAVVVGMIWFYT
jgi:hypothetical protein